MMSRDIGKCQNQNTKNAKLKLMNYLIWQKLTWVNHGLPKRIQGWDKMPRQQKRQEWC